MAYFCRTFLALSILGVILWPNMFHSSRKCRSMAIQNMKLFIVEHFHCFCGEVCSNQIVLEPLLPLPHFIRVFSRKEKVEKIRQFTPTCKTPTDILKLCFGRKKFFPVSFRPSTKYCPGIVYFSSPKTKQKNRLYLN